MSVIATGEGWVFCDNHQFFLTPQLWWPREFVPEGPNRLVTGAGGSARISTGIATGGVAVVAELHDSPPELATGAWEDVGEASVGVSRDALYVMSADASSREAFPNLAALGAETLRVRVHAIGRMVHYDGSRHRSEEKYLIQVWPAALAEDTCLKLNAQMRAGLTAPTGPTPALPPPPVLPPRSPRPQSYPG